MSSFTPPRFWKTLNEALTYIVIALILLFAISVPAFLNDEPNINPPSRRTRTSTPTIETPRSSSTTIRPIPPEGNPPDTSFLDGFIYVVGGLIALIAIYFVITTMRGFAGKKATGEKRIKEEKEKVRKVTTARDEAYRILRKGLVTGDYTNAYIEAFQALDNSLENFRDIARPKHFTSKEYSFSVREPIFRPSVYTFVVPFYNIRYGNQQAIRGDLEQFIKAMDRLFVSEVEETSKAQLLAEFESEMRKYVIPKEDVFDPRVPMKRDEK